MSINEPNFHRENASNASSAALKPQFFSGGFAPEPPFSEPDSVTRFIYGASRNAVGMRPSFQALLRCQRCKRRIWFFFTRCGKHLFWNACSFVALTKFNLAPSMPRLVLLSAEALPLPLRCRSRVDAVAVASTATLVGLFENEPRLASPYESQKLKEWQRTQLSLYPPRSSFAPKRTRACSAA